MQAFRLADEAGCDPSRPLLQLPCPVCEELISIGVASRRLHGPGKLRVIVHGPHGSRCAGSRHVFPLDDCQACDGSGRQECGTPWCTRPDEHAGECPACRGTGVAAPWTCGVPHDVVE